MKQPTLYLRHILDSNAEIERHTADGLEAFLSSSLARDAVLLRLQVLSQSTMQLPPQLTAQHPEVDWRGIHGFRSVLVHAYLEIELQDVWAAIEDDLPILKQAANVLLEEHER